MALVLVVDDDANGRELLRTLLDYAGHRTVEAVDGVHGLQEAQREPPDLIVADVLMPSMDGFEFVRRLRELPQFSATPVIFYSASYLVREARELASRCGVQEILTKPCEPEVIIDTINRALGQAHAQVPLPPVGELQTETGGLASQLLGNRPDAPSRLKALIDLGLEQAAEQDPQRLLASFCAAARKIIGARYAVVAVTDQASRTLHYRFTAGMDASVANAVSEAVLSLTPERISSQHLQIASGDAQMAGLPPSHPPVHDVIREPIASLGQVFGCLFLANKLGEARFSAEDLGLARVMTAQLARIYANASLYAQVQRQMSNLETEIYERQRAQEEVQQLNAELEQRIAIRTAALKEANAELEAFAQTVAHDLQTPLRAVNGFAKLLNDQYGASLPPEGKRFLDVVSSNARSMHQLLENMLAFARFAQQSLNVRPLDMTTLAHQACNDVHEHYRARELDVHIDALPSAPGDPLLLRQVWHNLLDNACKFSGPQDPIRIEVGGRQRSTECLYWVRDFGQGFASDQAGQLFSSFRRGSSMASDGVGLSVCKRIIQRHGGSIWADGTPGAGATFWFTLPRTAGGE